MTKVPIIIIVGKKEAEQKTISIRRLGNNKTETIDLEKAILLLQKESSSPN